jgi:hypothetical protein
MVVVIGSFIVVSSVFAKIQQRNLSVGNLISSDSEEMEFRQKKWSFYQKLSEETRFSTGTERFH